MISDLSRWFKPERAWRNDKEVRPRRRPISKRRRSWFPKYCVERYNRNTHNIIVHGIDTGNPIHECVCTTASLREAREWR